MSSILDALERAEKERNQIDKKPFMDRSEASPGLFQRRSLWVFAGLLLLVNLLVWFWVVMGPESASEQPTRNIVETERQRETLATADTVVSILEQPQAGKERKSDPPLLVEALVAKKVVSKPAEPASSPAAVKPMKLTSAPAEAVAQSPTTPEQPSTATVQPEPDMVQADVAREVEPTAKLPEKKLAIASAPQAAPVQKVETLQQDVEQDGTEQIPLLWELPANVQEKLSDLKINILVYDEDASRRFVIINMRKYREGDRLVPSGMQLDRITRKGVVIDYGDGLVRL
jgi:hypothetical protein